MNHINKIICLVLLLVRLGSIHARIVQSGERFSILSSSVITSPGTYFVSYDFVGTITIAADNVELDLNYKKISGAGTSISATSQANIIIKNGILENAFDQHILITSCTNVSIQDIDFIGTKTALSLLNANEINVFNCTCRGITADPMHAVNSFNINYDTLSLVDNNSIRAFMVRSCKNVVLNNITMNNNTFTTDNNQFSGVDKPAVYFEFSTNCKLQNNIFNNNTVTVTDPANDVACFYMLTCTNIEFIECELGNNTVSNTDGSTINYIIFDNTNSINCARNIVTHNASNNATRFYLFRNSCIKFIFDSCLIDNNTVSILGVDCIFMTNVTDGILQNSIIQGNTGLSTLNGLTFSSCLKMVVDSCIVQHNQGGAAAVSGYRLNNGTTTMLMISCIAEKNQSTGSTSTGFVVGAGCSEITIRDCISVSNLGTTSRGFNIVSTSSLFNNQAQDHGTESNNYVIDPDTGGAIPKVIYTQSTGLFSAPPTPFDNVSVQP